MSSRVSSQICSPKMGMTLAGLVAAAATGCASSAAPAKTPAEQAVEIQRTECGAAYRDDAIVAAVVDGSAVEGVTPLYNTAYENSRSNSHLEGAAIRVRPMKGETAEWLARALTCHGAAATLAQDPRVRAGADPFTMQDGVPTISVRARGDAFEIDVAGASAKDASEILSRARAMSAGLGSSEHAMAVAPPL